MGVEQKYTQIVETLQGNNNDTCAGNRLDMIDIDLENSISDNYNIDSGCPSGLMTCLRTCHLIVGFIVVFIYYLIMVTAVVGITAGFGFALFNYIMPISRDCDYNREKCSISLLGDGSCHIEISGGFNRCYYSNCPKSHNKEYTCYVPDDESDYCYHLSFEKKDTCTNTGFLVLDILIILVISGCSLSVIVVGCMAPISLLPLCFDDQKEEDD